MTQNGRAAQAEITRRPAMKVMGVLVKSTAKEQDFGAFHQEAVMGQVFQVGRAKLGRRRPGQGLKQALESPGSQRWLCDFSLFERLPELRDSHEYCHLAFIQRQRLGDQFFCVVILHIADGFAQQFQRVQPVQAAHRVAVEFTELKKQLAVRRLQIGQLQLCQPFRAAVRIFESRIGQVVGRFKGQG